MRRFPPISRRRSDALVERRLNGDQTARERIVRLRRRVLTSPTRSSVLTTGEDLTQDIFLQLAERLRLPEGTVKSRIKRARTELARPIQARGEQQDAVANTGVTG